MSPEADKLIAQLRKMTLDELADFKHLAAGLSRESGTGKTALLSRLQGLLAEHLNPLTLRERLHQIARKVAGDSHDQA